jgi:hypothetical protein
MYHTNWGNENFRKVPAEGVQTSVAPEELKQISMLRAGKSETNHDKPTAIRSNEPTDISRDAESS